MDLLGSQYIVPMCFMQWRLISLAAEYQKPIRIDLFWLDGSLK